MHTKCRGTKTHTQQLKSPKWNKFQWISADPRRIVLMFSQVSTNEESWKWAPNLVRAGSESPCFLVIYNFICKKDKTKNGNWEMLVGQFSGPRDSDINHVIRLFVSSIFPSLFLYLSVSFSFPPKFYNIIAIINNNN